MAVNRFTVPILLLSFNFICVSTRNLSTFESNSKLEGLVACMNDEDCDDLKNATCSEDNICKCNDDKFFICEEVTYPLANKVGGRCKASKNCNVRDSECGPQKKCICQKGYVSSSDRRKCLKISKNLGDPCVEHGQCSSGIDSSICVNNKCICQNGTHEYQGSCFKTAALGASCSRNEECSPTASSSCINSKCACIETYISVNQRCLQMAEDVGDSCEEDVQCTATLGYGSHCSEETCQCKDVYHYKDKNSTCVRDIFLNEICQNHSDCHQPGKEPSRLMCILGVCKCRSMYREENGYCEEISLVPGGASSVYVGKMQIFILHVFTFSVVVFLNL